MRQPWRQWSSQRRSRFSTLLILLCGSNAVWNLADDSGASLIVQGIVFVLLIPAVYVSWSAAKGAEQRFKDGEDSVHSSRAMQARGRREARQEAKRRR